MAIYDEDRTWSEWFWTRSLGLPPPEQVADAVYPGASDRASAVVDVTGQVVTGSAQAVTDSAQDAAQAAGGYVSEVVSEAAQAAGEGAGKGIGLGAGLALAALGVGGVYLYTKEK